MSVTITTDDFLDHAIAVHQFKSGGHRSGLDAILLAATVPEQTRGRVADLGAGAGVVGMAVAHRCPEVTVDLFEIDPDLVSLARKSIQMDRNSHLAGRVCSTCADVGETAALLGTNGALQGDFQYVVSNPPFNDQHHRPSPNDRRSLAHSAAADDPEKWLKAASVLLPPRGCMVFIVRPSNLQDYLAVLPRWFGGVCIKPIHATAQKSANRVLIGARKASRAATQILPPLIVHGADGDFTPEADAILRGRAAIALVS